MGRISCIATGASLVLLAGGGAAAQPPAAAAQPGDTVLRLAVDPVRNAGRGAVMLLDESNIRIEADGRWVQRIRQVVQVIDASAAASVAERAIGFAPDHQRLTVDWVRVVSLDGRVVSDRVAQEQESDVAAAMENPIYTAQRVRRLSLAGVAANRVVDVAFTLEELAPRRPGDFFAQWALNGPVPSRRVQFTVDLPAPYVPHLVERNLVARRREEVVGERRRYTWSSADNHPIVSEPFAADSNDLQQLVTVAPASTWNDVARWYDGLARPRYVLSARVLRTADSVATAARARTRADSVRAWHRWIAQDIRYLSLALGMGSYQPRTADEVVQSGAGDCKDKATLFVALLRRAGVEAAPVLVHQSGRLLTGAPSIAQFNHVVAAVRMGAEWTYHDLTAALVPFAALPESLQGGRALRVESNGDGAIVTLPAEAPAARVSLSRLRYVIDSVGAATGDGVERVAGPNEPGVRALFTTPLDAGRRAQLGRQIAERAIGNDNGLDGRIDSLIAFDGRDLTAIPELRFAVRVTGAVRTVGSSRLLVVPAGMRGPARPFRTILRELDAAGPRRMPIDATRILPAARAEFEWIVTLPAGWTVELPPNVRATSFFGSYESSWSWRERERELRLVRRLEGARGIVGPERMVEVLQWLRTVGADDQEFLTMKPSPMRAPAGVE